MQHKTYLYLYLIPLTLYLLLAGCKTDLSPLKIAEVILEVEHVETSEVWLKLNISNSNTQQGFIIERNGQNISEGKVLGDTIIIDEGLLPSHTYNYSAFLFDKIKGTPANSVSVTTGDTTSHNFTWTIDTLGQYPSYFNDVTIINENNIWAVGEIKTDSGYYGAAHWDGVKWKMVNFVWDSLNIIPLRSIWGESSNDLFVAAGSIFHWDGLNFELKWFVSGLGKGMNRIWGNEYSNLYFAGGDGTIIKYSEGNISQMNSGTNIDLKRISGNEDGNLFITGYEDDGRSITLEYKNDGWIEKYYSTGLPNLPNRDFGIAFSVWCGKTNVYFITLAGLLKVNLKTGLEKLTIDSELGINQFAEQDIEGLAENDLIIASNRGRIVHWNGYSWSLENEMYDLYPDHILTVYGADYYNNTVAIVGTFYSGSQGFIIIGKHY